MKSRSLNSLMLIGWRTRTGLPLWGDGRAQINWDGILTELIAFSLCSSPTWTFAALHHGTTSLTLGCPARPRHSGCTGYGRRYTRRDTPNKCTDSYESTRRHSCTVTTGYKRTMRVRPARLVSCYQPTTSHATTRRSSTIWETARAFVESSRCTSERT